MSLPKTPTWVPQRQELVHNQPGNPFGPGPNLQAPPWAPGGLLPGPNVTSGPYAWGKVESQAFQSDGTNQVWLWDTPVFDLRPGMSAAYGQIPAAVPINHEAALGQSVYLVVIIGEASGAIPPALSAMTFEYFEDGNTMVADNGQLMRLTQDIPITETVLAGGIRQAAPFGASALSLSPVVPSIRFWKLSIRITSPGVAPVLPPYFIMSSLH